MLDFFFLKKNLFNFFQSGLYIDYILKKVAEVFTRNVLIYTGLFFCEKFVIEFFTKKIVDNLLFISRFFQSPFFFFESFFSQILFILFYFIFLAEFVYIFI